MWSGTSLSARISGNIVARYAFAVLAVVTALLVCDGLGRFHVSRMLYVILFPAVAFSGFYCGIGPSVVALVVAVAGARYWFTPPTYSFRIPDFEESISLIVFLFACGVVLAMGEARRRDNENIRRSQGELEDRVRERTTELNTANQNLRELSARLLQLQDEERRRIARELHDSIGQMLTALTMNLSSVRADIERLAKTASSLTDS